MTKSPLILTLYDFQTCFDAPWLEDSLNVLWDAGVKNELFYMMYLLNKSCNIVVNTPFGQTRNFHIENLVKQGTTLGPLLCGTSIGDYSKSEYSSHAGAFLGQTCVRPLAFMDDLGNPTENVHDTSQAHQDALHFQLNKKVSFGYDKCEILIIGKDKLSVLQSSI